MKTIAVIEDDQHIRGRLYAEYEEGRLKIVLEI